MCVFVHECACFGPDSWIQGSCCVCESQSAASYRIEIGEEADRRRAVDPEWQEVLQLSMSLRLEGSSWQCQGAQEGMGLALGKGTYSRGGNKGTRKHQLRSERKETGAQKHDFHVKKKVQHDFVIFPVILHLDSSIVQDCIGRGISDTSVPIVTSQGISITMSPQ